MVVFGILLEHNLRLRPDPEAHLHSPQDSVLAEDPSEHQQRRAGIGQLEVTDNADTGKPECQERGAESRGGELS